MGKRIWSCKKIHLPVIDIYFNPLHGRLFYSSFHISFDMYRQTYVHISIETESDDVWSRMYFCVKIDLRIIQFLFYLFDNITMVIRICIDLYYIYFYIYTIRTMTLYTHTRGKLRNNVGCFYFFYKYLKRDLFY